MLLHDRDKKEITLHIRRPYCRGELREGLASTRGGKITFNKESTVKNKGLVIAECSAKNPLIRLTSAISTASHFLPQCVLHVSEQSQGNPRKVFG